MKKKIDAMTAISILFIILIWGCVFIRFMNSGTCDFDTLVSLEQLFGGIVYAMPIAEERSLNGYMRDSIRYYTSASIPVEYDFVFIFNNKIYSIKN